VKAAGGNQQALRVFLAVTEKLDKVSNASPDDTNAGGPDGGEAQGLTLSEGPYQGSDQTEPLPGEKIEPEQEPGSVAAAASGTETANAPNAAPQTSP